MSHADASVASVAGVVGVASFAHKVALAYEVRGLDIINPFCCATSLIFKRIITPILVPRIEGIVPVSYVLENYACALSIFYSSILRPSILCTYRQARESYAEYENAVDVRLSYRGMEPSHPDVCRG